MARKDSENQKQSMSVLFRGRAIFKPLNTGRIDEHVACVREWVANIFFYTKNGTTIMIDAGYNYSRLKEKMGWLDIDPESIRHILITHQDTDHVGALERDSELLFRDATVCKPFTGHYSDPKAPYDGYEEEDDTQEHARGLWLPKQDTGHRRHVPGQDRSPVAGAGRLQAVGREKMNR